MADELTVRVITPERIVVDTSAKSVQIPASDGSMGIFPKHAGMVAALDSGEMRIVESDGRDHSMFVSGGFAEVRGDTVRVLTSVSEDEGDIDVARAKAAERRARERLDQMRDARTSKVDIVRANAALRRALMRLKVTSRHAR